LRSAAQAKHHQVVVLHAVNIDPHCLAEVNRAQANAANPNEIHV
jgi:hypothetical protein